MHTEVHNAVMAADQGTQYDESAKRLLGQKSILAQILVRTVDEFKGMNPRYVETLIEGEPYISRIPLEPGLTNQEAMRAKSGQRITGLNTENQEHAEGLVRFDIVFYVRMKDGLSQIIINVEAQKDEPQRYGILNRAVFYVSRLISSQKERDFENTEYDDIKRVYSIWVCMNMEENSLSHIHLVKDDLVGYHDWRGKLNLFNIVMIGLAKKLPKQGEQYELHRLLGALFAEGLTAGERLNIIKEEYDIPIEQTIEQAPSWLFLVYTEIINLVVAVASTSFFNKLAGIHSLQLMVFGILSVPFSMTMISALPGLNSSLPMLIKTSCAAPTTTHSISMVVVK